MARIVYAFGSFVLKADLLTVSKGKRFAQSVVSTSDKIATIVKFTCKNSSFVNLYLPEKNTEQSLNTGF